MDWEEVVIVTTILALAVVVMLALFLTLAWWTGVLPL